jgi:molybdopterin-containing oxidoreductase family membrane subunit
VVIYLNVLILECMPTFARLQWLRDRWPRIAARMEQVHHYAPYLAIVGLGLSSMHQSSLGAAYGVIKARPFWYKPEISVLFMLSALIGGISLTLFASMMASRLTSKARVNDGIIERVAGVLGWLLLGYFYFRFWDMFAGTYTYEPGRSEGLRLMTSGALSFNFWIGEMLLGAFVPMVLLINQRTRRQPFWRMAALFLAAAGVVAYRWDINLSGQLVVLSYWPAEAAIDYTSYRPALIEWVTGLGIVAYGLLAFSLGVKYLRVVDHTLIEEAAEHVAEGVEEAVPAHS